MLATHLPRRQRLPLAQARPQPPQFAESLSLVQVPLQQVPALLGWKPQGMPFDLLLQSLDRQNSSPKSCEQNVAAGQAPPSAQDTEHLPNVAQVAPVGHARPHSPQLFASSTALH
jgi:hypothetical protein